MEEMLAPPDEARVGLESEEVEEGGVVVGVEGGEGEEERDLGTADKGRENSETGMKRGGAIGGVGGVKSPEILVSFG